MAINLTPSITQKRLKKFGIASMNRVINFAGYGREEFCGSRMYVCTRDGQAWLDFCAGYGVFSMGHSHPHIIAAVRDQLELMPLSAKVFYNPVQAELMEILASLMPFDINHTFFANSGTEAVEGALKLARLATGKPGIIAAENAFHGKTMGALSVTGRDVFRRPFEPLIPEITQVPYGDKLALAAVINEKTAAVILEPIQGEGGIIVPPDGYLADVRQITKQAGVLLIIDEVQTGLGRTGKTFGFEHDGIVPDIVCLGKALGGGVMPIAAFMGTDAVWQAFEPNPTIHTSTFGGNPLACAAAIAAIDVMIFERLAERSRTNGKMLMSALRRVAERHPTIIAEVRGRGLMIGVELTEPKYVGSILPEMARQHVIVVYTLNKSRVIRFEPPLIMRPRHMVEAVVAFEKAVTRAEKDLGESSK